MSGICRVCGCTWNTPCYTHKEGNCWWVDETQTICSHCYYGFTEPSLEDGIKENGTQSGNHFSDSKRKKFEEGNKNGI